MPLSHGKDSLLIKETHNFSKISVLDRKELKLFAVETFCVPVFHSVLQKRKWLTPTTQMQIQVISPHCDLQDESRLQGEKPKALENISQVDNRVLGKNFPHT